jgi:hypothetical protein
MDPGRPNGWLLWTGGLAETGHAVVDLIRAHHRTNAVDLVGSTHPDGDRVGGPKLPVEARVTMAILSGLATPNVKHPSRRVTNGFRRRGTPVFATTGTVLRHGHNALERPRYVPAAALPLFWAFEE